MLIVQSTDKEYTTVYQDQQMKEHAVRILETIMESSCWRTFLSFSEGSISSILMLLIVSDDGFTLDSPLLPTLSNVAYVCTMFKTFFFSHVQGVLL